MTKEDVARVILERKQDIWNKRDKELLSLVEDFFENSLQTLEFYNALDRCLNQARERHVIVKSAITSFKEDVQNQLKGPLI
ncbi:UPF0496 protein 1 [Spatholobus suberectus]|nr:UPF0496 protein 1 [Spatholobus suberectus]